MDILTKINSRIYEMNHLVDNPILSRKLVQKSSLCILLGLTKNVITNNALNWVKRKKTFNKEYNFLKS